MGEKLLSLQNLLDNLDKTKIMISPSLSMLLKCYAEDYPWRKRLTCLVKRSLGMSLPSKKRAFIFYEKQIICSICKGFYDHFSLLLHFC